MNGFYWLASYPKSGNTWLRVFLTNYWRNADTPADINQLDYTPLTSMRTFFDTIVGVESSLLTPDELDRYRPAMFRLIAEHSNTPVYFKAHDLYADTIDGEPLLPRDVTLGAIYLLRNPLDVAVSFAHHNNISPDQMIEHMATPDFGLVNHAHNVTPQLRQRLGTWGQHVVSWVDSAQVPLYIMRYEDMTLKPHETFAGALRFIGEEAEPARLEKALRFSQFDVLQAQEAEAGFYEKMPLSESFFRKGKIGSWREKLSAAQADRIINDHRDVMRRFGYLTDDDQPVY